jgi:hypothetical protein
MVNRYVAFQYLALFLPGKLTENSSQILANLSEQA